MPDHGASEGSFLSDGNPYEMLCMMGVCCFCLFLRASPKELCTSAMVWAISRVSLWVKWSGYRQFYNTTYSVSGPFPVDLFPAAKPFDLGHQGMAPNKSHPTGVFVLRERKPLTIQL